MTANGSPVCSEKNIEVEFEKLSTAGWDTSLPGTDPQVTLNVVAFTMTFPTPELGGRTSKMVEPINPGELNSSFEKKGSNGAVTIS